MPSPLGAADAARYASMALRCLAREYPQQIQHVLRGPADAISPRALHPVFFGCYDWHSAVHAHWAVVRLLRHFPDAPFASTIASGLDHRLTRQAVSSELAYLNAPGRAEFERPYGLAWLLLLASELTGHPHPRAESWATALAPLTRLAAERLGSWVETLPHPIRSGEHSQSAFAMGLALDWAETAGEDQVTDALRRRALAFHLCDVEAPLSYEPSGHDFLSPCLAEADLLRRVLRPQEFADWLEAFLPDLPGEEGVDWLPVAACPNPADGKLAHLQGLNLSRAWMLEGMAAGLPPEDPRQLVLLRTSLAHAGAGLSAVRGDPYAGSHWLASFAVYLTTRAGI